MSNLIPVSRRNTLQQRMINRALDQNRPKNTKVAYAGKQVEFVDYCNAIHSGETYPTTINEAKLFDFLFYQAYRNLRPRGKKRKHSSSSTDNGASNGTVGINGGSNENNNENMNQVGNSRGESMARTGTTANNTTGNMFLDANNGNVPLPSRNQIGTSSFDRDEFNAVMAPFSTISEVTPDFLKKYELERALIPKMTHSTLSIYKSAVLQLHSIQRGENSNCNTLESLNSARVTGLMKVVDGRTRQEERKQCKERMNRETSPYVVAEQLPDIEDKFFWNCAAKNEIDLAGLRNRFTWLLTLNGMLRGESLFKADLADFFVFEYKAKSEPHRWEMLVLKLETGKTNKNKTLFGRVIRHRNVKECAFGAFGFYLLARFARTNELSRYDFGDNTDWFHSKVLIADKKLSPSMDLGTFKTTMSNYTYALEIGRVCKALDIQTTHFVHLGRKQGPIQLEMAEVPPEYIKILGNWNPDTQESVYSSKLPLPALRVAAGFEVEKGSHYNPRTEIEPPQELQQLIFPELESVMEGVTATINKRIAEVQNRTRGRACNTTAPLATAVSFLKLLKKLRRVILQDAAAMKAVGRTQPLFEMPVFKSELFLQFADRMASHLEATKDYEPVDAQLQRVLPTVTNRMTGIQQSVGGLQEEVNQLRNNVMPMLEKTLELLERLTAREENPVMDLAGMLQAVVDRMRGTTTTTTTNLTMGTTVANTQQLQPQLQQQTTTTATRAPGLTVAEVQAQQKSESTLYTPNGTYDSVMDMWTEWHENGVFDVETLHDVGRKSRPWRKTYTKLLQKRFTRMKTFIELVDKLMTVKGWAEWKALLCANSIFLEHKKSLRLGHEAIRRIVADDPQLELVELDNAEELREEYNFVHVDESNNEIGNDNHNDETEHANGEDTDEVALTMVVGDHEQNDEDLVTQI